MSAEVAKSVCASVAKSLEGRRLASFTGVSALVRSALEEAVTRVLSPKRSVDVLAEIRASQARAAPYSIVFVGVNGVGKSTNLAKIAYWLRQQKLRVMIAACDTFRCALLPPCQQVSWPQCDVLVVCASLRDASCILSARAPPSWLHWTFLHLMLGGVLGSSHVQACVQVGRR